MKFSRSVYVKAAGIALALAAAGTASVAQARGNVYFSVGGYVAPGVSIGVSNAPMYYPPVYAPVYVQPAPIVYPAPVYYGYPYSYYPPAPVVFSAGYYGGPHFRHHHRHGR